MWPTDRHVVAVVGAGIAGLSAAVRLLQTDQYDVTVLEAADRCGGRMLTEDFGEGLVELGANWIHGETLNNSVFTLAAQTQQLTPYVLMDRMEGYCYTEQGKTVDPGLVHKVWTHYQGLDHKLHQHTRHDHWTLDDWVRDQFEELLHSLPEAERRDARAVVNCVLNLERFHNGGYLQEMLVGPAKQYEEQTGGNVKLPLGTRSLVSSLTNTLPPHTLQYRRQVTNISLHPTATKQPVHITCESGPDISADHVIFTCSLGVLKHNHRTLFTPQLPRHKVHAIENMGFGRVGKVFLYYSTPFWVKGKGGMKFCWSDETARPRCKEEWYKKLFGFDEVLNNPGVLVGWVSGDEAAYMESLPLEQLAADCSKLIKTFLVSPHLPDPTTVSRSNWSHNPLVRGSYSYLQDNPSVIPHLQEPVCSHDGVPRVLFAGEATHPSFYSTMHGARSSGIREAERLLSLTRPAAKL